MKEEQAIEHSLEKSKGKESKMLNCIHLMILFQYDFESLKPGSSATVRRSKMDHAWYDRQIMLTSERFLMWATNRGVGVVNRFEADQSQPVHVKRLDNKRILLQGL